MAPPPRPCHRGRMATHEDRTRKLAVLIDADNVPSGYAEAIFEEIAALGYRREAIGARGEVGHG